MDDEFSVEAFKKSRAQRLEQQRKQAAEEAAADPELAAIRSQTARAQDDTVDSSRNALRQLKETVELGESTKTKLYAQGEQLDRIERTATQADENAQIGYEAAKDLHKHKGILPFSIKQMLTGKKKKKQDEELKKKNKELDKQLERGEPGQAAAGRVSSAGLTRREYADEKEQEIDENLDEISSNLAGLRGQAAEMNEELQRQNVAIGRTGATIDHTDYTLNSANRKLKDFM